MEKIKVFISSRSNSDFYGLDRPYKLKDLREYLRDAIEAEKFLGELVFEVIINEKSFKGAMDQDAYNNCLDELRSSNIVIFLYNGEAGWPPTDGSNGICYDEFVIAMESFSFMSYPFNISSMFKLKTTKKEEERNKLFQKEFQRVFTHMETVQETSVDVLNTTLLKQIKMKLLDAFNKSFQTQKLQVAAAGNFKSTLDWSKLNYSQREEEILKEMRTDFVASGLLKDTIINYKAIPDHMSVADARNRIGRPFLEEHLQLDKSPSKKKGLIHFIGVYGNATEIQVKNMVGYPDLTVIKTPFGFYLWDKTTHIQMFFFSKCINYQTIGLRQSQVKIWLDTSGELENVSQRAEARFEIIEKIKDMQKYSI